MTKFFAFFALLFVSTISAFAFPRQSSEQSTRQLSDVDRILVTIQKVCPVMGAELGSMGQPVKTKIADKTLFLCCESCEGKPAKKEYLASIMTRFAQAQNVCPITGKPVEANSPTTIIDDLIVFACCPNCIDKIQAEPAVARSKIEANYASFVSDELQIAAQGICPVSGQKLGSMGNPIRVMLNDQTTFLCCKACVEKPANGKHWATIQGNLKKAQAVCPVTGESLPKDARSVVVDGRQIYVCCPSCIEDINGDKAKYLARLNDLYSKSMLEAKSK